VGKAARRMNRCWSMPQGGVEEGEEPLQAAKRELFEETGIKADEVDWIGESNWYIVKVPEQMRQGIYNKFNFQRYKWYLTNAKVMPKITLAPEEYSAYKWEVAKTVINQSTPFKEEMYRNILHQFGLY